MTTHKETRVVVRTFLASPSDVLPERKIASTIVDELNSIWGGFLGIVLELVRWETHAYPGIGDDAQAVINDQIDDNYDIFIGIMWGRLGTPTHRARSGTAEEFERAYRRFMTDPTSVRIMFYFKSVAPDEVGEEQIRAMEEFRERVIGLGVLPWTFATTEDFQALLRLHLSRQVQHYFRLNPGKRLPRSRHARLSATLQFVGLPLTLAFRFTKMFSRLRRLSAQTAKLGNRLTRDSTELSKLALAGYTRADAEGLLRGTAYSISEITAETTPLLGPFAREFDELLRSISKVAPFFVGAGPAGRLVSNAIAGQLRTLHEQIVLGTAPYVSMRGSMSEISQLDRVLEQPAREAAIMFDEFVRVWTNAGNLVLEAERTYRRLTSPPFHAE